MIRLRASRTICRNSLTNTARVRRRLIRAVPKYTLKPWYLTCVGVYTFLDSQEDSNHWILAGFAPWRAIGRLSWQRTRWPGRSWSHDVEQPDRRPLRCLQRRGAEDAERAERCWFSFSAS